MIASLAAPGHEVADSARRYQASLTKPVGSLGRLESLGSQLCGIYRTMPPPAMVPAVALFAADHGVVVEGVSPWPSEVTAQMVANICNGGAAVSVLTKTFGATLSIVDVGVANPLPNWFELPGLLHRRVRGGTGNILRGAAMTLAETEAAMTVGAEVATQLVADGANVLIGGEMGIGNTTSAAAIISSICGADPRSVTGRGTGADDDMYRLKTQVVADAIARSGEPDDPVELLAELGGLEIAALTGFYVGAAARSVPVILDGVISVAAALVAHEIDALTSRYMIAGHRSQEPGATLGLAHLRLQPLLDLELRLGEASGAILALPLVHAAGVIMREMATFEAAAISGRS